MAHLTLTRRQAMQAIGLAVLAVSPLTGCAESAKEISASPHGGTVSPPPHGGTASPPISVPAAPIAKAEPLVQPQINWSAVELNEFLNEVPPEGLLSLKKALELLPKDAAINALKTHPSEDVDDIEKQLLWISSNITVYPFRDPKKIPYHELVKWVAGDAGVDQWILDTQPTFVIERAIAERLFVATWDKLDREQRKKLLEKIDDNAVVKDTAGIAALSGAGALAALAPTVYFAGFTFYTTMSVMICTVAEWLGVTLPFAAYTTAATLVAFLGGPFGWALLAIAAAAGIAFAGRADVKKTTAAIIQIHALKVAALQAAGKQSGELFQSLGDPLKRQLVGKWRWQTVERHIEFNLKSDDTFTAKDIPDKTPGWLEGKGLVSAGKGNWFIKDGCLTINMTDVWVVTFWKEHKVTWIDGSKILKVEETKVLLADNNPLDRM